MTTAADDQSLRRSQDDFPRPPLMAAQPRTVLERFFDFVLFDPRRKMPPQTRGEAWIKQTQKPNRNTKERPLDEMFFSAANDGALDNASKDQVLVAVSRWAKGENGFSPTWQRNNARSYAQALLRKIDNEHAPDPDARQKAYWNYGFQLDLTIGDPRIDAPEKLAEIGDLPADKSSELDELRNNQVAAALIRLAWDDFMNAGAQYEGSGYEGFQRDLEKAYGSSSYVADLRAKHESQTRFLLMQAIDVAPYHPLSPEERRRDKDLVETHREQTEQQRIRDVEGSVKKLNEAQRAITELSQRTSDNAPTAVLPQLNAEGIPVPTRAPLTAAGSPEAGRRRGRDLVPDDLFDSPSFEARGAGAQRPRFAPPTGTFRPGRRPDAGPQQPAPVPMGQTRPPQPVSSEGRHRLRPLPRVQLVSNGKVVVRNLAATTARLDKFDPKVARMFAAAIRDRAKYAAEKSRKPIEQEGDVTTIDVSNGLPWGDPRQLDGIGKMLGKAPTESPSALDRFNPEAVAAYGKNGIDQIHTAMWNEWNKTVSPGDRLTID